ncbi:hypothetical protein ACHAQH_010052 [Verticillium albo-atrum]
MAFPDMNMELLDDIIETMQHNTLRIVEQKIPQGKRNDSRTESRTMGSVFSDFVDVGRSRVPGRNSGRFSAGPRSYGRPHDGDVTLETSSMEDGDDEEFASSSTPGAAVWRQRSQA